MAMVNLLIVGVLIGVIAVIVGIVTRKDRYAEMTEEQFEREAKRASLLGAAITGFHQFLQPKRVEYILRRDKRAEGEQAESGNPASTGHPSPKQ